MKNYNKYFESNRALWNERVEPHCKSDFYDLNTFKERKTSLKDIELEKLGDITDKRILHLQCHFGQDTLSLAELGADATGVDFSDAAIIKAKELSKEVNLKAEFICCNIYDLKNNLDREFDIVFTSYGTIGWLPDIRKWADIVSYFLKPGGKFLIVEFHHFIWMLDTNFEKIHYPYFHSEEPIEELVKGSYADDNSDIELVEYGWNHPISDVINALIDNKLTIESLKEYDYSPYDCFPNMEKIDRGKYVFKNFGNKLPLVYSLSALKKM